MYWGARSEVLETPLFRPLAPLCVSRNSCPSFARLATRATRADGEFAEVSLNATGGDPLPGCGAGCGRPRVRNVPRSGGLALALGELDVTLALLRGRARGALVARKCAFDPPCAAPACAAAVLRKEFVYSGAAVALSVVRRRWAMARGGDDETLLPLRRAPCRGTERY